jgi:uncharacterized protein (TIGR03435 family)
LEDRRILRHRLTNGDGGAHGRGGLFTAFPEQLGLKLDPSRAPVDVLVIDKGKSRRRTDHAPGGVQ